MTKILHSKYGYYILVMKRTDGGIFSTENRIWTISRWSRIFFF